jgi:hypothetical protein
MKISLATNIEVNLLSFQVLPTLKPKFITMQVQLELSI